jgi:phage terminase large subunit GpA-like protein
MFDDMVVYLRRERRNESLDMITNSLWVLKLNTYETIEWNSLLKMGVSSKFYFISYDMAVLKTTQ